MSSIRAAALALIAAALSPLALQPACAELICPACDEARIEAGANGGSSATGGLGADGSSGRDSSSGGGVAEASPLADARPEAASPPLLDAPLDSPPPVMADAPDAPGSGRPHYVGVHPNFPLVSAASPTLQQRARDARLNAIGVTYPWIDPLYTWDESCSGACPACNDPADCTWTPAADFECRRISYDQLRCEYEKFFESWLAEGGPLPANDRVVLVNIGIANLGDRNVGPRFLWPLQTTPDAMHEDPTVWSMFQRFYDRLYEIMNQEKYRTGTRWILTLQGPSICPADEALSAAYLAFHRKARTYIRDSSARAPDGGPNVVPTIAVSIPFFSRECDGLWDFALDRDSAETPALLALSAEAEAIVFTYDPMDYDNDWRALSPARVGSDIARMKSFRDQVAAITGSPPELLIGGTAYATYPSLHGSTDERYSRYASGEEAQRALVQNLVAALSADPAEFLGYFWSLLVDVGPPDGVACQEFASIFVDVDSGAFGTDGFRAAACTNGLIEWPVLTNKPAWDELVKWK